MSTTTSPRPPTAEITSSMCPRTPEVTEVIEVITVLQLYSLRMWFLLPLVTSSMRTGVVTIVTIVHIAVVVMVTAVIGGCLSLNVFVGSSE
ncbi:hypothetical protein D9758_001121 [Tetrapyrgos nigripes]|uniref:Uncharacterized protein n=1 Tax=Tetrapyrgos nigripes TaxID=182062 RepID=A0A8H5LUI4_9AGAR|nr:hypothetical protein D9758_001121 [Tetrapyrgos nigripes]